MITQTFPSKRPAPAHPIIPFGQNGLWYTPQEIQQANLRKITPMEYVRRDKIITKMYLSVDWRIGDTCFPVDVKDYEKYGGFMVTGLLSSYKDLAFDHEWPKNDQPMILTLKAMKSKTVMFCTPGWIQKQNTHLKVEC